MSKIIKYLKRESSLESDVCICIAALLTSFFYFYENHTIVYGFEFINEYIKLFICSLTICIWFVIMLENGAKKRVSFCVITIAVWIIPQVIAVILNLYDSGIYSNEFIMYAITVLRFVSDVFMVGLSKPASVLFNRFGIPYAVTLNSILVIYIIAFIIVFYNGKKMSLCK